MDGIIDLAVVRIQNSRDKIAGQSSGSSSGDGRAVDQNGRGYDPTQSFGWLFDLKTLHLALYCTRLLVKALPVALH